MAHGQPIPQMALRGECLAQFIMASNVIAEIWTVNLNAHLTHGGIVLLDQREPPLNSELVVN